jgi:hypothetical protein
MVTVEYNFDCMYWYRSFFKLVLNSQLCIVYECTLYTAIYGNLYFYINTYSQTVNIQQSPLKQMQKWPISIHAVKQSLVLYSHFSFVLMVTVEYNFDCMYWYRSFLHLFQRWLLNIDCLTVCIDIEVQITISRYLYCTWMYTIHSYIW